MWNSSVVAIIRCTGNGHQQEVILSPERRSVTVEVAGQQVTCRIEERLVEDIDLDRPYTVYYPTVNGLPVSTSGRHSGRENWLTVAPGVEARCRVELPTDSVRTHPEGRECGECRIFDPRTAQDLLDHGAEHFQNGSPLSSLEWQAMGEAEARGLPPLTRSNMGWCWRTKALVGNNAPACVEHFLERRRA